MRLAKLGKSQNLTSEQKKIRGDRMRGKKMHPNTMAALSKTWGHRKGKKCKYPKSPETRLKLSIGNKGKKVSEETKQKMRDSKRIYWENRRQKPEVTKFNIRFSHFTNNVLRKLFQGDKNYKNAEEELGYTREDLKLHIESTWETWMNWNNYGKTYNKGEEKKWNIDHIKPVSRFLLQNITEISIVNALSNLRALDANENSSKRKTYKVIFQET